MSFRSTIPFLVMSFAGLLAGCINVNIGGLEATPDPARFYVLGTAQQSPVGAPSLDAVTVGIRTISVPDHLNTPQFALRKGPYELSYSDDHRWVSDIGRTLAQGLETRLKANPAIYDAMSLPWPDQMRPQFAVDITLVAFEADQDGHVRFVARWQIDGNTEDNATLCLRGETSHIADWDGSDYGQIPAELTVGIDKLAADIAAAVQ